MALKLLGIDPGTALIGWAFIQVDNTGDVIKKSIEYGTIKTQAGLKTADRLLIISDELKQILKKHKPDVVGVESVFFHKNQKTAINVAQARGVVLLEAARIGAHIVELTPLQVKESIVGYGRAEKKQMQNMLKLMLGLKTVPEPDDAADAIGIAICAGQYSEMVKKIKSAASD